MLHYAAPPTVGGVESTIAYHARGLADAGYTVRVLAGSGAVFDARVELVLNELLGSRAHAVLAVKRELDSGSVTAAFETLVKQQHSALQAALADTAVCIVHNVHSLNKNLPLTAALARLEGVRCIAWCHDLAWTNPQYQPELHPGYPWDLLRTAWANTRYVTVSEPRRAELAKLLGIPPEAVQVIEPGVDPGAFFGWTNTMQFIQQRLNLLDADGIVLLPARLTRRKNIALALHVLAVLRAQSGRDFRLVISGPPGPHNPANPGYLGELLDLRRKLGLEGCAHFLYELAEPPLIPDDATLANLYQLADALLFPSIQEGFGIPVLEAGLAGVPVFCADIPPLRHTGQDDAHYFDPLHSTPEFIAQQMLRTLGQSHSYRLRVRVRQQYRWDTLISSKLMPLLEAD